ncbi:DUF1330 domain-containing protein [Desulfovibrio aerotolerans]|uniref:DUF1330 domain-containing protein n=1 Tax=Solidesulfovibrio aerotolerans TaxID=295255 RepID=A0A7C9N1W5_9BACT|nr:DUF1330 domain-containing protein [Solidesulfovibrio aerotolerans]MYL83391.1 DUF1330 domain-containing protein [Solidesulfovibrio aerotolerans]
MAAYLIFIREKMRDATEYDRYKQLAPEAMQGHAFTPHVVYGPCETLEGPDAQGVVVLEFASREEARAFYCSPAYQEASRHRHLGCDYRVLLTEGREGEPPAAKGVAPLESLLEGKR